MEPCQGVFYRWYLLPISKLFSARCMPRPMEKFWGFGGRVPISRYASPRKRPQDYRITLSLRAQLYQIKSLGNSSTSKPELVSMEYPYSMSKVSKSNYACIEFNSPSHCKIPKYPNNSSDRNILQKKVKISKL